MQCYKTRIFDIYKQNRYASIKNSNHLETNGLCQHPFHYGDYLNFINLPKYRLDLL